MGSGDTYAWVVCAVTMGVRAVVLCLLRACVGAALHVESLRLAERKELVAHVGLGGAGGIDGSCKLGWTDIAAFFIGCGVPVIPFEQKVSQACNYACKKDIPLEAVMTTWKLARYCPLLFACSAETGEPHKVHLILVVLGGFGQFTRFAS